MKWLFIFLVFAGQSIAQENSVPIDVIDTITPIETRIDERTTALHYLSGGELVALQKCERGEFANRIQTTWYFNGENIWKAIQKECRTDDTQILDIAMYNEAHRKPDGKVNYDDLPANCVSVTIDFTRPEMTRTIEGSDVFAPLREYSIEKDALYQTYLSLVKELSWDN